MKRTDILNSIFVVSAMIDMLILAEIAKALDCTLSVNFTMNDTGETL